MSLFASVAPPSFLRRRLARAVGRGGPLPLERRSSRARARLVGRCFALLLTAALVNTVCVGTAWRHRCSDASCRALARGRALIYQPRFRAASASLRSSSRPMPTRRVRRLHAARRVGAGKHDFQRDDRSGLLQWARESKALATSGGRKKRRRTSSTVIISEARLSRAWVGAASVACSTS
jgi:hypothetical protein